jgi:hypothetical protein
VEQDEDSIETIYFSAIPHDWFTVDNSSEQKHFLFPPPSESVNSKYICIQLALQHFQALFLSN